MKLQLIRIEEIVNFDNFNSITTIFANLSDADTYPLVNDFINDDNYEDIGFEYLLGYSSEKYLSPIASKLYHYRLEHNDTPEDAFSVVNAMVTALAYRRFGDKWKRLFDALMEVYNPLENYNMSQTETPGITHETTKKVSTDVTTSVTDSSSDSSVYGFNDSNPSPSAKVENSGTTTISGDGENNIEHTLETETGTRGLTRSGNIGVTTSQQMLTAEFEVRKYDFFKTIYNDIDKILCLKIY